MNTNIWVITEYTDFKNVVHQWFFVDRISALSKFESLKSDIDNYDYKHGKKAGRFIALSGPHTSGEKIDTIYGTNETHTWTFSPYTNSQAI